MANNRYTETPQFKRIDGTDLVYIISADGVVDNGDNLLIAHLIKKSNGAILPTEDQMKEHDKLGEYVIKVFNTYGAPMEEFMEDYKKGYAQMVAYTSFVATQVDAIELDKNGNILLRSAGSHLSYKQKTSYDYLISKDGEILIKPPNYSLLQALAPADENGYYYSHIYQSKSAPMSRIVDVYRRDYNFFDRNGVRVRRDKFERTEEPTLHALERSYRDDSDGKLFIKQGIYPKSYVFDSGLGSSELPRYFPSPAHLLVANRQRREENANAVPYIQDEEAILMDHYNRQRDIRKVQAMLTKANIRGTISQEKYYRAMRMIDEEQRYANEVFSLYETPEDLDIENAIALGEDWSDEEVME